MVSYKIHLNDWSKASPQYRHALFCLAYRLLSKGESKRTAIPAVAKALGLSANRIQKLGKRYIPITLHDQEG